MQPIPLWPVTIFDFQWEDHAKYQDRLKHVCQELESKKQISGVAPGAKRGLYESGFDFCKITDPAVEAFSHWVKDCMFKAALNANQQYWPRGINIEIDLHESWCHITRDGGYHDMHTHPMSSWSSIYYLDCADMDRETKNGLNRFYCPYQSQYIDAGTAWTTANTSIDFCGEDGMMVVFPSWLQHNALPYHGQRERYVIAVNARVNRADMTNVALTV